MNDKLTYPWPRRDEQQIMDGDRVIKQGAPQTIGWVCDLYEQDGVQMAEVLWPAPDGAEYVPAARLMRHVG